ncbi:hypothetical protein Tco_1177214, partial [Tanacetum coccineum]
HVKRRPQSAPVRRVEALTVDGARRRGRPKLRCYYVLFVLLCVLFCPLFVYACYALLFLCFFGLFRPFPLFMPDCFAPFVPVWCVLFVFACLLGPWLHLFDVVMCPFSLLFLGVCCDALSLAGGLSGSSPSILG